MSFFRRPNKMGNISSVCHYGHSHRSKLEGSVCNIIRLREMAGELKLLQVEDHVMVCGINGHVCNKHIKYVPDFKCQSVSNGEIFWIEAKGYPTDVWAIKKTLWRHYGPGQLEIWGGSHLSPHMMEILPPGSLIPEDSF